MESFGILTSNSTLSNDSPSIPRFSDLSRRKLMTKGFDVKNQAIVRDLSKKLGIAIDMNSSIVVETAMTYLKEAMHKRNVDSIKVAEFLRHWLSDFQDEELEYFELRVDLGNKVKAVDTRSEYA